MKSSFILGSKHDSLEQKEHETNFLRKMVYPRQKKPCNCFLKKKKNLYCLFNNYNILLYEARLIYLIRSPSIQFFFFYHKELGSTTLFRFSA